MKDKLPWHKEYRVFGIPKTFKPYSNTPVYEILRRAAKKFKKMGYIQLGSEITYPEVLDQVKRLAAAFHSIGIDKGDRIATLLPTSIQFVIVDYGISMCGAVQIPSSHLEPLETLVYKFGEGKPRVLVCLDEYKDIAFKLRKKAKIETIILTKLEDYSANPPDIHEKVEGAIWLTDIIAKSDPDPPKIELDVETNLETLLFTGGTTGLPKGCMLTHRNIFANTIQSCYSLGAASRMLEGAITVLLGLPFFHSYGHSVMHSMTNFGFRQILIPDPRDTKNMVDMITMYLPVMQVGVPTQFMKLQEEELEGIGILGISGSAALPEKTQEEFEKKGSGAIMEGYGLSEMSPVTHMNISLLLRLMGGRVPAKINNIFLRIPGLIFIINRILRLIGSNNIGRIIQKALPGIMKSSSKKISRKDKEKRGTIGFPAPDTEIKIIDVDTEEELNWDDIIKRGKTGEMCLNGPQRMLGYWPDKGSGMNEEGFVHTGDVVRVDEQGYFYIVDRTKDMIVISGYKVYSREIDDILHKHPAVEMVAAVGIPDPKISGSERVVVYIQLKPEYKGITTEDEIIEFLGEKVAKYAVPRRVCFIDDMPLTEVQKVNKKLLRKIANKEIKLT